MRTRNIVPPHPGPLPREAAERENRFPQRANEPFGAIRHAVGNNLKCRIRKILSLGERTQVRAGRHNSTNLCAQPRASRGILTTPAALNNLAQGCEERATLGGQTYNFIAPSRSLFVSGRGLGVGEKCLLFPMHRNFFRPLRDLNCFSGFEPSAKALGYYREMNGSNDGRAMP